MSGLGARRVEAFAAPASFAQQRLWLLDQVFPRSGWYNVPMLVRLRGALREDLLERSLAQVVARHEILRTSLAFEAGELRQMVWPALAVRIERHDLASGGEGADLPGAIARAQADALVGFELDRAPLLRAALYRIAPDDHCFLLCAHHVICDAESMHVLMAELSACYVAELDGRPAQLPALPIQYADFAAWQRERLQGDHLEALVTHWKHRLAGAAPLELPIDRPRPPLVSFNGRTLRRACAAHTSERVRALARAEGTTVFAVLLAALATVLHQRTGERDIVVGTSVAGRDRVELEPLIGCFVNVVALRVDAGGDPTFRELVSRARDTTVDALSHQELPFERLLEALGVHREFRRVPLCQVGLALISDPVQRLVAGGLEITALDLDTRTATTELTIFAHDRSDGLELSAEYNCDLFSEAAVEPLLVRLEAVLSAAADAPDTRFGTTRSSAAGEPAPGEAATDGKPAVPSNLTAHQLLLWAGQRLHPESALYDECFEMSIRGELRPEPFRAAFASVVARSDALRTVFTEDADGRPHSRVLPELDEPCAYLDLRDREDPQAAAKSFAEQTRRHPSDLTRRCFEAALLRTGEAEFTWVFRFHNLVLDGWGAALVWERLRECYPLALEGRLLSAPPLLPFSDYLRHEQRVRVSPSYSDARAWWELKLAAGVEPLCLYGKPPLRRVSESRRLTRRIEDRREERLRALAARREFAVMTPQLTWLCVLLTALFAYLARVSGSRELCVGVPLLNRTLKRFRETIGTCFHVCPVRVGVDPDESFRALFERVKVEVLDTLQRQHFPVRSRIDSPAYEVMFNFRVGSGEALAGTDSTLDWRGVAHSGLVLNVRLHDEGRRGALVLEFDVAAYLLDDAESAAAVEHFLALLDAMAADPDAAIGRAALLGAEAAGELERELAGPDLALPEAALPALFEAQVARTPDREAVRCAGARVSYAELERRVADLARGLCVLGVEPGTPVALLLDRGVAFVAAVLAIWKAGGFYLPLSPSDPPARLATVLADSRCALVLTRQELLDTISAAIAPPPLAERPAVVSLETVSGGSGDAPAGPRPDDAAYVIYTSGSTGVPKGAIVEHRGMVNHLLAKIRDLGLGERDAVVQNASQCFDVSVWQMIAPLLVGGRVEIVSDEIGRDPRALVASVRERGITVLETVPSLLHLLTEEERRAEPGARGLSGLRWLVSTGEVLASRLCRDWLELHPRIPLLNAYGPTECSDDVTHAVVSECAGVEGSAPIGRPIQNVRLHVVCGGEQHAPAPRGVPGELWVSGPAVGRGYLGDPEKTRRSFVAGGLPGAPVERCYRTGDLVRQRADGALELLGRLDQQLKVRGFRVEPGEVEAALTALPGVLEAAVVARAEPAGHPRLVAYLVARADAPASRELHGRLRSLLPEYMVPSAFVYLDQIPRTHTGKLDRGALPPPGPAEPSDTGGVPRGELETRLARAFAEVLGVAEVGRDDDFFALGGDSILAIQLVARLRQQGIQVSPRLVFEHPSVARLAAVAGSAAPRLAEQGPVIGEAPLTPLQAWFLERGFDTVRDWHQVQLLDVGREVRPEWVAGALDALLTHHDALRMRFRDSQGAPSQYCAGPGAAPEIEICDLSKLPRAEASRRIGDVLEALCASLDIESGPLLRAALFDLGDAEPRRLLIVVHHLVMDAVSWRILLEDFELACRLQAEGSAVRLPAKTTSFREWAIRLAAHADSDAAHAEAGFWLGAGDEETRPLPVDRADGADTVDSARVVSVALDPAETQRLMHDLPKLHGARVHQIVLAALARSVARWAGLETLLVDLEGHGREEVFEGVDVSRTVGFFTCVHPLRLPLAEAAGTAEAVQVVAKASRQVPAGGIGYGLLRLSRRDPELGARLHAQARAELAFNFLGRVDAGSQLAGGRARTSSAQRPHRLLVDALVAAGRLELHWEYSENVYDRRTVAALAEHTLALLRELLSAGAPQVSAPPRFPLARCTADEIAALGTDGEIEDVYPLSPAQQEMLVRCLETSDPALYAVQLLWELRGSLDRRVLESALAHVVARHPVLRTRFAWEGLREPHQVVVRAGRVELAFEDLGDLPHDAAERRHADRVARDLVQGFDLAKGPLLRVSLARLPDGNHRLLWTNHHLVTDGWCTPHLVGELAACYAAFARGEAPRLPAAPPFRDFVAWLATRKTAGAERFWRDVLRDAPEATRLGRGPTIAGEREAIALGAHEGRVERQLDARDTRALAETCRRSGLTLSTAVLGAWALCLARASGRHDVVFGQVVSGRPVELAGAAAIIGPFVNVLPVRARIEPGARVGAWLAALQRVCAASREYEYSSAAQIAAWTGRDFGTLIPESVVVFQNVAGELAGSLDEGLDARLVRGRGRTQFPVTLEVFPSAELRLVATHDGARLGEAPVASLVGTAVAVLRGMALDPERTLASLEGIS